MIEHLQDIRDKSNEIVRYCDDLMSIFAKSSAVKHLEDKVYGKCLSEGESDSTLLINTFLEASKLCYMQLSIIADASISNNQNSLSPNVMKIFVNSATAVNRHPSDTGNFHSYLLCMFNNEEGEAKNATRAFEKYKKLKEEIDETLELFGIDDLFKLEETIVRKSNILSAINSKLNES